MPTRPAAGGAGWQTSLADLSLMLFMTAAATLGGERRLATPPAADPAPAAVATPAAALAVWEDSHGAPALGRWLARRAGDRRERLTLVVGYGPGGLDEALAEAGLLAREAGPGSEPRIVVEPGAAPARALVGFDARSPAR